MNVLQNRSDTARELIAEGRKQEALRMTHIALGQRFGALDQTLLQALEQAGTAALEDVAFDTTLTIEQLHRRLGLNYEALLPAPERETRPSRTHTRLSPLGGFRNHLGRIASAQGSTPESASLVGHLLAGRGA
jgi:hypothetical protein